MLRSDQAPWRGGRNLHLSANVLMRHHLHLSANQRREHELRYTKSLPTVSAAEASDKFRPPRRSRPPTTHIATRPGDVWCWDVTFLQAHVQGFYLYLILDLYSRKIVGFEVHDTDSADHAAHLARRTALAEAVHAMPVRPVLHGDNGATLKATTVLAMLHWLGIEPSYSRPRVSDDNPYAEALFRTAKYRPEFPVKGFAELDAAREWAARFVHWYNDEHRHSGIRYVTPSQRHAGQDRGLLAGRHELYQQARRTNPRRWSGQTRDWTPVAAVTLNPERDTLVQAVTSQIRPAAIEGSEAEQARDRQAFWPRQGSLGRKGRGTVSQWRHLDVPGLPAGAIFHRGVVSGKSVEFSRDGRHLNADLRLCPRLDDRPGPQPAASHVEGSRPLAPLMAVLPFPAFECVDLMPSETQNTAAQTECFSFLESRWR